MKKLFYCATLLFTVVGYGFSEENTTDSEQNTLPAKLSGSAQLGFIMSTGSSHTSNANGKLSGNYQMGKWTYQAYTTFLHDSDYSENSTHERYETFGQSQYNFSEKNYLFVNTDWLDDSDDGFDYLWNNTVGYGRELYQNTARGMLLTWQAGPGYRFQPNDDKDIADEEVTANTSFKFQWNINDINRVEQTVGASYANNETIYVSNTAYTAKIYENISLQMALDIRHNTNTPEDSEPTDTITTMNILYSF